MIPSRNQAGHCRPTQLICKDPKLAWKNNHSMEPIVIAVSVLVWYQQPLRLQPMLVIWLTKKSWRSIRKSNTRKLLLVCLINCDRRRLVNLSSHRLKQGIHPLWIILSHRLTCVRDMSSWLQNSMVKGSLSATLGKFIYNSTSTGNVSSSKASNQRS